jgi:hypothetical protein
MDGGKERRQEVWLKVSLQCSDPPNTVPLGEEIKMGV